MLDLEKNIEYLNLPEDCRLVIKESIPESPSFGASQKRYQEYLLSRECLQEAAGQLGYPFQFDLSGQDKKVNLSPEVSYSLSHSKNVAAAIVCQNMKWDKVGIDLEIKNRQLSAKFIQRITTPLERKLIEQYPQAEQLIATLIFSAKESIYKAFSSETSSFSYQNMEVWESAGHLQAILINQEKSFQAFRLEYGFYKQTHLVTCLMIPKY